LYDSADRFLLAEDLEAAACVLLDVRMPGMSGLNAQEVLIERGVGLPVIFLTGHGDVPMAVNAIKRGAVDFIEKPFNDDALLSLIDAAVKSNRRLRVARAARRLVASRIDALSPREREVMEFVIAGKPNKIIADQLGISIKTVEVHRARVMQKLGVGSVAELAQAMIEPTAADFPPMPRF
jgi:FixJ family two-component response regulator